MMNYFSKRYASQLLGFFMMVTGLWISMKLRSPLLGALNLEQSTQNRFQNYKYFSLTKFSKFYLLFFFFKYNFVIWNTNLKTSKCIYLNHKFEKLILKTHQPKHISMGLNGFEKIKQKSHYLPTKTLFLKFSFYFLYLLW